MNLHTIILSHIKKAGSTTTRELMALTGFSRAYISRRLRELVDDGAIALVGRANRAKYVLNTAEGLRRAKADVLQVRKILRNEGLSESVVFSMIRTETGIIDALPRNVQRIVEYAFTEMLNNAIEHSRSEKIEIRMKLGGDTVSFDVKDWGVGIFAHIQKALGLANELEALQELLKGKQTTAPEAHSGEGIFFTSRVADRFAIVSHRKQLVFDNLIDDVFVRTQGRVQGTRVTFSVDRDTRRRTNDLFKAYTSEALEFDRTEVAVRLYRIARAPISRSQARRVLSGLEEFRRIVLDFRNVDSVGQAFADEVFRIWQSKHPSSEIVPINANEDVRFMIGRARAGDVGA